MEYLAFAALHRAISLSCVFVCALGAQFADAGVVRIPSTTTSITGHATRMISYRDQNHSWQTSDGAYHLMVNLGATGLTLYSSFDQGTTWKAMFSLADTDGDSTDDGVLTNATGTGATLQLVYATSPTIGAIRFATATYDIESQSWLLVGTTTAYQARGFVATNPAFAPDSEGNIWCSFTLEDKSAKTYQQSMVYAAAGSQQWTNTGLVFGVIDTTTQHSARPVAYPNGVGVIYQDADTLYWAYRQNGSPVTGTWETSTLYVGLPDEAADPYGTHYSVVADAQDNLYLAFIADPAVLMYVKYTCDAAAWGSFQVMESATTAAAYPEMSLADGNVVLMANDLSSVNVLQSTDGGESFTWTQKLTHPPATSGSGLSYANPRVETPRYSTSPMPVWQQFVDGTTDGLMFFLVPVIN
jgi:hypothetical protein